MPVSEPIVVLYKSSMCRHCQSLSNIWDKPPSVNEESVTSTLRKIYPKLRFYEVTAQDNSGKFDENMIPKDLIRYGRWFPMILLIPGKLWDNAMLKLGPNNDVKLVDGVQIMNGLWKNNVLDYVQKYDIRKASEFGKWLKEGLENPDYVRVVNTLEAQEAQQKTIQPLVSTIVKPINSSSNYIAAGSAEKLSSLGSNFDLGPNFDVCTMRLISRK